MSASEQATGEDLAAQLRRLQDDLDAIKDSMAGLGAEAGHKARSAVADIEIFGREHPRAVLAGAVGFGLILGLLLRRH